MMLFDFRRPRILSMPGTAEQPDVPEKEYDEEYDEEYDLPEVEETSEPTPSVTEEPTQIPEPTQTPVSEAAPVDEKIDSEQESEENPEPTPEVTPEPTAEPVPEPTEAPIIEIEDEETPLSGGFGMDGVLSDVMEGASYIGNIYNESLYVEVRPLSDFYKEDHELGQGVIMMILGGTLMLSASIAMIGAGLVRRARERELDKWQ